MLPTQKPKRSQIGKFIVKIQYFGNLKSISMLKIQARPKSTKLEIVEQMNISNKLFVNECYDL